jgi:hypothetical protein
LSTFSRLECFAQKFAGLCKERWIDVNSLGKWEFLKNQFLNMVNEKHGIVMSMPTFPLTDLSSYKLKMCISYWTKCHYSNSKIMGFCLWA